MDGKASVTLFFRGYGFVAKTKKTHEQERNSKRLRGRKAVHGSRERKALQGQPAGHWQWRGTEGAKEGQGA